VQVFLGGNEPTAVGRPYSGSRRRERWQGTLECRYREWPCPSNTRPEFMSGLRSVHIESSVYILRTHSVRTNSAVLLATESFLSSNFSSRRSARAVLKRSIASRLKPDKRGIYRALRVDSSESGSGILRGSSGWISPIRTAREDGLPGCSSLRRGSSQGFLHRGGADSHGSGEERFEDRRRIAGDEPRDRPKLASRVASRLA